ncbi:MAG: hypothetical protein GY711_33655 [bacterium]|nr:hypothetical protein [bacterium]
MTVDLEVRILPEPGRRYRREAQGRDREGASEGSVRAAQRYVQEGRRIVVDVDLEKFFDRVNHDVLMGKLARGLADKRVLGLIRRYLQSGSPLLANVLLDEVDKELEKRGHAFVRYADDGRVFVHPRRAGERVLNHLRKLYSKLQLRINETKSAVARAWDRDFLGYSMWVGPGKRVRLRVAKKALEKMKGRVRQITGRQGGRSMTAVVGQLRSYLTGWRNYWCDADIRSRIPARMHAPRRCGSCDQSQYHRIGSEVASSPRLVPRTRELGTRPQLSASPAGPYPDWSGLRRIGARAFSGRTPYRPIPR